MTDELKTNADAVALTEGLGLVTERAVPRVRPLLVRLRTLKDVAMKPHSLCKEAAEEIERSCAEAERLRADRATLLRELDLVLRHYEGVLKSEYQTRSNPRPDEACPVATHARHIIAKMYGA